jgi:hypothetical protein
MIFQNIEMHEASLASAFSDPCCSKPVTKSFWPTELLEYGVLEYLRIGLLFCIQHCEDFLSLRHTTSTPILVYSLFTVSQPRALDAAVLMAPGFY